MMRQRQTIVKTLAAVAIAFGMQTPAQAQFGGLLKKAKQAVKEKVDDAKNSAKQQAQGTANGQVQQAQGQPGQTDQATQNYINQLQTQHDDEHSGDFEMKSDGSYWIWRTSGYGTRVYDGDKLLMGIYYPKERKIWLSSETFTIADDGKVYDGKGEWRAIIQKNRLVTCNAEAINIVEHEKSLDLKIGEKLIGQVVGKVTHGDYTGTYLASKGKFYNWKLTDASGKQVGLLATNASPNLAAAWAFLMFAKK